MPRLLLFGLVIVLVAIPLVATAQESAVTAPDLTGLNVPQAVAALNRNGLRMGATLGSQWTPDAPAPMGTVGAQSLAAGDNAPFGTIVDITVLTTDTILVVYDDNDITMVNQTSGPLDMAGLAFSSADGTKFFAASEWTPTLEPGDCGQLWSVTTRREPKRLPECDVTVWQGTNQADRHFWTSLAGVSEFMVVREGVPRLTCPAAPAGTEPLRCNFFLSGATGEEVPYIHFAYTTESLAIINTSDDRWMPLDETPLLYATTEQLIPRVRTTFTDPDILGDVTRLAPGQCLLFATGAAGPPQSCDVLASTTLTTEAAFWQQGFLVDSSTDRDREPKLCPPADVARQTRCILPR